MRAISWNVLNKNRNINAIITYIKESGADIIALQELSDEHIEAINSEIEGQLIIAKDCRDNGEMCYLGIISRHPISEERIIAVNSTGAFSESIIGKWKKWQECLETHTAAVPVGEQCLTVGNLHLTCAASPGHRRRELANIMESYAGDTPLLICGDFNSFARPYLNVLIGPFYGFRWRDYHVRELDKLRNMAKERGMILVKNSERTFPGNRLAALVLDHFMIKGLIADSFHVHKDTHGSDHYPVVLDFHFL